MDLIGLRGMRPPSQPVWCDFVSFLPFWFLELARARGGLAYQRVRVSELPPSFLSLRGTYILGRVPSTGVCLPSPAAVPNDLCEHAAANTLLWSKRRSRVAPSSLAKRIGPASDLRHPTRVLESAFHRRKELLAFRQQKLKVPVVAPRVWCGPYSIDLSLDPKARHKQSHPRPIGAKQASKRRPSRKKPFREGDTQGRQQ